MWLLELKSFYEPFFLAHTDIRITLPTFSVRKEENTKVGALLSSVKSKPTATYAFLKKTILVIVNFRVDV